MSVITIGYYYLIPSFSEQAEPLSPPRLYHWFGTDINGNDVFIRIMEAFGYEILNLMIVFFVIWLSGLLLGSLVSWIEWKPFREFFLNFIHYMATLPVLLIALFLLIIFGAGFINAVIILSIAIIPTQVLFVYNQVESAQKEEFVIAKKSYGLSDIAIYKYHLIPFIARKYNNYTLSRIPEIIMMNLALSFLGLGLQEPHPSLGRMLFDGLAFMFSGWWLWIFPILIIIFIFYLTKVQKLI
jgi:ABC-type dipeptide/oligopeptide/nickel transport system permease subunit